MPDDPKVPDEPKFSEEYYEHLAKILGQEAADWARLPYLERWKALDWHHKNFNTPDDLSVWPPELGGEPKD